jgi:hypothetical protein
MAIKFAYLVRLAAAIGLACTVLHVEAATLQPLSSNLFRLSLDESSARRVAIDVSSDLRTWAELTTVPRLSNSIVFSDPGTASGTTRFYRFADADRTFRIKGYVDGGERFGAIGGAVASVIGRNEVAFTDTNGFFILNERFSLDQLPLQLGFWAYGYDSGLRTIYPNDAGSMLLVSPPARPFEQFWHFDDGVNYRFEVTSGAKAGMRFNLKFSSTSGGYFFMDGDIVGTGYLALGGFGKIYLSWADLIHTSTLQIGGWPGNLNFSGIPSPTGETFPGNGILIEEPMSTIATPPITSLRLHFQNGISPGETLNLQLSGGTLGAYTVEEGSSRHSEGLARIYQIAQGPKAPSIRIDYENDQSDNLVLLFESESTGRFYGTQGGHLTLTPADGTFEYSTNVAPVAPNSLAGQTIFAGESSYILATTNFVEKVEGKPDSSGTWSAFAQQNSWNILFDGGSHEYVWLHFLTPTNGVFASYSEMKNLFIPFTMHVTTSSE